MLPHVAAMGKVADQSLELVWAKRLLEHVLGEVGGHPHVRLAIDFADIIYGLFVIGHFDSNFLSFKHLVLSEQSLLLLQEG